MCGHHRKARCGARRSYGRNAAAGTVVVYQRREGLIRKIVNHIIESREQKQLLASGQFVQPRALGEGKQEKQAMGVNAENGEWADDKQKLKVEDLGNGVNYVRNGNLPSYREALKN